MSTTKNVTASNLLFFASRKLREAACGYATDLGNVGSEAEEAAEDKLHQAALDYALVANAIDGQGYALLPSIDEETKARILGTVTP